MTASTDSARAGEMMVDLPTHRRCFADHRFVQIACLCRGAIHDDGKRCLQSVRQIARMATGFFGLLFVVIQQCVEFVDHRHNLIG